MDFWTFVYYSATFWITFLSGAVLASWFVREMGWGRKKGGEK